VRERVTITLPPEVVADIDRRTPNRSRFVLAAVQRELERLRRAELRRSLSNPHPESEELAEAGFAEWAGASEGEGLLDDASGTSVRWSPGTGWVKGGK
jgi:hypothetical protein